MNFLGNKKLLGKYETTSTSPLLCKEGSLKLLGANEVRSLTNF